MWTDNVSHGELIRDGVDQTMTIDPANLTIRFSGNAGTRQVRQRLRQVPMADRDLDARCSRLGAPAFLLATLIGHRTQSPFDRIQSEQMVIVRLSRRSSMRKKNALSRREFVAGASGLVVAGAAMLPTAQGGPQIGSALAIHGGTKAVRHAVVAKPRWGERERRQLDEMLRQSSLFYWKGPQTELLKQRFREVCPVEYVQTCSSGTAAIHAAVAAAGIGLGDEVITSPVTDIGTVIGVIYQQAVPVFADLGRGTHTLDVVDVERRITPKTKAIIAVHLAGNPCDLDALRDPRRPAPTGSDRGLLPGVGSQVPWSTDRHRWRYWLLFATGLETYHLRRWRHGWLE